MGSPAMNFIDAEVTEEEGSVKLVFGQEKITVPEAKAKLLVDGGYVGKKVVMGIRPEDIHDDEIMISSQPEAVIETQIKLYELLGAEVFLYFDIAGTDCTARVNPRTTARIGDTVKFAFDLNKLHVFDKETEKVIAN
jgi:multiple sugar transport system ATP-binding protein